MALFACLFGLFTAPAADARQLLVFVERESLADMRVLNSAPASRGVPLRRSHRACGTLPLSLFFLLLFLISSLPRPLSTFLGVSSSAVISTPAVDPHRRNGPARHDCIPAPHAQERRLCENRGLTGCRIQPIISLE